MKRSGLFFLVLITAFFTAGITFLFISKKEMSISSASRLFKGFTLVKTEGDNFFISYISQIRFAPGKIFILDHKQKKIFVFDNQMSFLYSIGRSGQGPGDLDNPVDFDIHNDQLFILDIMTKRIDILTFRGEFVQRINLELPKDIFYAYPSSILVDTDQNYLLAYSLSEHCLDLYDTGGRFKKTFFERGYPVVIYRKNIGNTSFIGFSHQKNILYFNAFEGHFVEIYPDGIISRQFQIEDKNIKKTVQELKQAINKEGGAGSIQTDVISFSIFTNFCIDTAGRVYVCQRRQRKGGNQRLWIFAPNGENSISNLSPLGDGKIRALYCQDDEYFFVTDEEKIWITERRTK